MLTLLEFVNSHVPLDEIYNVSCILFSLSLSIVFVEIVVCIIQSMRFQVDKLTGFRERFAEMYNLDLSRKEIIIEELRFDHKNYWCFAVNVMLGRMEMPYQRLLPLYANSVRKTEALVETALSNVDKAFLNAVKFLAKFFLCFPYFFLSIMSFPELVFRWLLTPIAFWIFKFAALIKIKGIYQFAVKTIQVNSQQAVECPIDVIYHKTTLEFHLHSPHTCSDEIQKDNLNNFTTSLKQHFPRWNKIKLKLKVIYSDGLLQQDLPMVTAYLKSSYTNITYL